ncbi:MAG TPA: response regulator transcription factor, partial [Firmicutes bacterium]|nr:response regulator transcription factor [Bacillota bacterium]
MADELRMLLVAEDNVMRRAALAAFSDVAGFEVEATDPVAGGIAQAASSLVPDVVLLWLQSTRGDRVALVRAACSAVSETPVVIMVPDARQLAAAMALVPGVAGYILSGAGWEEVVRALRAVVAGKCRTEERRELVLGFTLQGCTGGIPPLSGRQEAILRMISDG